MANEPSPPVRQNYHPQCKDAVNSHINLELHATFMYLAMSFYFNRDNVALENFAQLFLHRSVRRRSSRAADEAAEPALGRLRLHDIRKPNCDARESSLKALECAFHLEKVLSQSLLIKHRVPADKNDPHLCSFLESNYPHEQIKAIRELSDYITNLRKMGPLGSSLAEYLCDKPTLGNSDEN